MLHPSPNRALLSFTVGDAASSHTFSVWFQIPHLKQWIHLGIKPNPVWPPGVLLQRES